MEPPIGAVWQDGALQIDETAIKSRRVAPFVALHETSAACRSHVVRAFLVRDRRKRLKSTRLRKAVGNRRRKVRSDCPESK